MAWKGSIPGKEASRQRGGSILEYCMVVGLLGIATLATVSSMGTGISSKITKTIIPALGGSNQGVGGTEQDGTGSSSSGASNDSSGTGYSSNPSYGSSYPIPRRRSTPLQGRS